MRVEQAIGRKVLLADGVRGVSERIALRVQLTTLERVHANSQHHTLRWLAIMREQRRTTGLARCSSGRDGSHAKSRISCI
jgi:hypothetical protein